MIPPRFRCWLILMIAILPALQAEESRWPVTGDGLTPDPAWTYGRLENGLRYAVRSNPQPAGHVSFRFAVQVGFAHEAKEERGFAHMVEHMGFNGTTHFPGESLMRELEKAGLAVGPEVSAFTFLTHTLYQMDTPTASAESIDRVLTVLRDFADGMQFEPEQVRREIGIVASEIRDRQSPGTRTELARRRLLYPVSSLSNVSDVTPEQVNRAQLRQFYDKWYRPERMILVVAGDADPEQLEAAVRRHFDSLRAHSFPAPVFDPGFITNPVKPNAVVAHEPKLTGFGTEVISVMPRETRDSAQDRRAWAGRNLVLYMLNARLGRLRLANPGLLQSLQASTQMPTPYSIETSIGFFAPAAQWTYGISTVDQELRRSFEYTFTADEISEAKAAALSGAEQALKSSQTRTSDDLAGWFMQRALWGYVNTTPEAERALTRTWLAELTALEMNQSWRSLWQAARASMFGYGFFPSPNGAKLVEQMFAESGRRPVEPPKARPKIQFAYTDFGPPVAPVRRERLADLDIDLLEFPNGVRVNLKRTTFEAATVYLTARLGRGQQTEPTKPGLAVMASAAFLGGALGRHSPEDLRRVLADSTLSLNFSAAEDTFAFTGQSGRDTLGRELELLTAYLTDPGWDRESYSVAAVQLSNHYNDLNFTPEGVISARMFPHLTGSDPRYATPEPRDIQARTVAELRAWLEPELRAAPLEIGLVGDFDPDTIVDLLARTVGTLPKRRPPETAPRPVKFSREAPDRQFEYRGEANRGGIEVVWPLDGCDDVRTSRAFQVVTAILNDRAIQRIREDLGAAYAPSVSYWKSDVNEAQGYLMAYLTVKPKDMRRIRKLMVDLANEFARDGASQAEFDRALQPILGRILSEQKANSYWLYHIIPWVGSRQDVRTWPATRISDFQTMNLAEINALAKRTLASKRAITFTAVPAKK